MLGRPDGLWVMDMGREFGVQHCQASRDDGDIKRIDFGQLEAVMNL